MQGKGASALAYVLPVVLTGSLAVVACTSTQSVAGDTGDGGVAETGGAGGSGQAGGAAGSAQGGSAGSGDAEGDFAVESVNLELLGAFGPAYDERVAIAPQVLAGRSSDVLCVEDTWGPDAYSAIASGTAAAFPYRAAFGFDLNSQPDDPTDQTGAVPAPYTTAPCASSEALLTQAMSCVRDHCVKPAGDDQGRPLEDFSACLTRWCVSSILPLLTGTSGDKACYSCFFTGLMSFKSTAAVQASCTQDPKARYAWDGSAGTFILSKLPIQDSKAWVLPSTEFRIVVERAGVQLPKGEVVDVYCSSLTEPGLGITRQYTGQYGGGTTNSDDAWTEELYLQAERLVQLVQSETAARAHRSVLAATLHSGPAAAGLTAANPLAFSTVSEAFPLAVPAGFEPSCTTCGDNPYLALPDSPPATGGVWDNFVFLAGSPTLAVRGAEVTLQELVVSVTPSGGAAFEAPISPKYGFRARFDTTSP